MSLWDCSTHAIYKQIYECTNQQCSAYIPFMISKVIVWRRNNNKNQCKFSMLCDFFKLRKLLEVCMSIYKYIFKCTTSDSLIRSLFNILNLNLGRKIKNMILWMYGLMTVKFRSKLLKISCCLKCYTFLYRWDIYIWLGSLKWMNQLLPWVIISVSF